MARLGTCCPAARCPPRRRYARRWTARVLLATQPPAERLVGSRNIDADVCRAQTLRSVPVPHRKLASHSHRTIVSVDGKSRVHVGKSRAQVTPTRAQPARTPSFMILSGDVPTRIATGGAGGTRLNSHCGTRRCWRRASACRLDLCEFGVGGTSVACLCGRLGAVWLALSWFDVHRECGRGGWMELELLATSELIS